MTIFIEIDILCIDEMHNNEDDQKIFKIIESFDQNDAFEIIKIKMQYCCINVKQLDDNFSKKNRKKNIFAQKNFSRFFLKIKK